MSEKVLLSLRGLHKRFETQEALNGLDLEVYEGEFLTLLGPSGCGKTTTLRIIAGLEQPSSGQVLLEGQDLSLLPPEKRQVNTVFQSYALFPHMSVGKNITFGLRMRGANKTEISSKLEEMLHLVQLQGYENRMPHQLSGGQRQRVAIARSLILSPRILLLDEPLGALDLQLRRQMQQELKAMQQRLGITFIYITHDQEEALSMSDRIGLMRDGSFVQIGSPKELYEKPLTAFAGTFIGDANLLVGTVQANGAGEALFTVAGAAIPCKISQPLDPGEALCLCVRSERIRMSQKRPDTDCVLNATLEESRYAGGERVSVLRLSDGQKLSCRHSTQDEIPMQIGQNLFLSWDKPQGILVKDDKEALK